MQIKFTNEKNIKAIIVECEARASSANPSSLLKAALPYPTNLFPDFSYITLSASAALWHSIHYPHSIQLITSARHASMGEGWEQF
jgi:hypothetical protein